MQNCISLNIEHFSFRYYNKVKRLVYNKNIYQCPSAMCQYILKFKRPRQGGATIITSLLLKLRTEMGSLDCYPT